RWAARRAGNRPRTGRASRRTCARSATSSSRLGVIRDPVIVLGAPRSGTSMLFETLARSSQLWSLTDESHEVLEGPYHPRLRGWESNVLAATDLDPTTADRLRLEFEVHAQPGTLRRAKQDRRDPGGPRPRNHAAPPLLSAL